MGIDYMAQNPVLITLTQEQGDLARRRINRQPDAPILLEALGLTHYDGLDSPTGARKKPTPVIRRPLA